MADSQNKNTLIANRYADALAELAKSNALSYEKIAENLNLIDDTLNQSVDLDTFLTNPLISIEDKKEIIDKIFANEVDALMVNFLKVLVDKNRFYAFKDILIAYNKTLDKINNISRVGVVSAVTLSDDAKNRLKHKLEEKLQKSITLNWEIDSKIIAGLIIKMGDNIIDTSLKNKIEDMSKSITK